MMKIKVAFLLLGSLVFYATGFTQVKQWYRFLSPSKNTTMEIGTNSRGSLQYRMLYAGEQVTGWSALGVEINGIKAGGDQSRIKSKTQQLRLGKFAWPLGEDDEITNNYTEGKLECVSSTSAFSVQVRVYDGSIAFSYELPARTGSDSSSITKEYTSFNFTGPYTLYQYNQESVFTPVSIDTFTRTCDLPATLTNQRLFIGVGEAGNLNYTKAELKKGAVPNSLVVTFPRDSAVRFKGAYRTPWRTVSVSRTAIGLHDYSQLYLKLAAPAVRQVPAWVKPGKLIRAQLNTQSGLDCIDFAAKHNLQYIMFDAGWYGAEFRSSSDPTQVIPQMDLPGIIAHGKEKGIGVILYVNYVGLRAKLDTIIPLYKKWGVAGMKFGFVDGLTQGGLTWLSAAIKKAADAGFVIDVHDNYKPTGLSRVYPALLTQEGIRGDENSPDAFHTTVLPFTRFLAGPADFTFCYPNEKNSYSKNLKVSMGQQLALTVIFFSPLQSMFWYGQPNDYTSEQEIEFFRYVPTVWNESHYLAGDIGRRISVARRQGATWFVGNAAGPEDWTGEIKLDFLSPGKTYTATVFEDDGNNSIRKRTLRVRKGDVFPIALKAATGQALMIK